MADETELPELTAFCVLLHWAYLTVPVLFTGQFPADVVTDLESKYDVGFNYDSARNETILL
jgi:hypothetical protein